MKRYTLYSAILAFGLLMGACAEDDGNYDYTSINEITIETIDYQMVLAGEELKITPVITAVDESSLNLSYEWAIGGTVVSNERNLDIALPPMDYGEHLCAFTIKDLDNGMQYRQTFTINITNPFNYGYYFLTRLDDGSTEMAYIQAREEDDATLDDVLYATGVGNVDFGNEPMQISGKYTYIDGTPAWQLTFLTKEGDNPAIITNNITFSPMFLITEANFVDEGAGYEFHPECTAIGMMEGQQVFISDGQCISYTEGKLYRPAQHQGDYYWSHAVHGTQGAAFAWVFDENSRRCYSISADTDRYAYDKVTEPDGNVTIDGTFLYSSDAYVNGGHQYTVYAVESDGIHLYTFTKATVGAVESKFESETVLSLPGANENTKVVAGTSGLSTGVFYTGVGNKLYSSPTTAPTLTEYCTLPSDLGSVEYLGLSARGNRLVVVMYDENSSEERKGSVLYIDVATRAITHTFPHILHHCAAYWGGNDSSVEGYGNYGDQL